MPTRPRLEPFPRAPALLPEGPDGSAGHPAVHACFVGARRGASFARAVRMPARSLGPLPRLHQASFDDELTPVRSSPVLRALDRPIDPGSRVESQEMLRCELMRALDAALSDVRIPAASQPIHLRESPNPFLAAPHATPWIATPWRDARRTEPTDLLIDVSWQTPRRKRRSRAPYALLALVLAIGVGHAVDRRARATNGAALRASARTLSAHVVTILPARK
jgi:hypothetical protein